MNSSFKLALAVAAAIAVASCGKKEEAPAPKAADAKPAAPAGLTVTIAHAGPLTGSIAHLGKDDENGVALAIENANKAGIKLGGQPVTFKMVSEDDQADPKVGTTLPPCSLKIVISASLRSPFASNATLPVAPLKLTLESSGVNLAGSVEFAFFIASATASVAS